MMQHGIKVDLTPPNFGGVGAMYVNEKYMSFEWDEEKLFFKIEKPNEVDLAELEIYQLQLPIPEMAFDVGTARRKKKFISPSNIPIDEWRKRFAMLPDQVVKNILENST
eukprot:8531867-Ditylum_brightwellii.AAC.1